jgi:hypothetical protein
MPSAFDVAEAWAPSKYKNQFPVNLFNVRRLSLFNDVNTSPEYLASRRFNLKKQLAAWDGAGSDSVNFLEARRQAAIIQSFKKSLPQYASKIRGYGKVCEKLQVPHFPASSQTMVTYASMHATPQTLQGHMDAIHAAEMFVNIPESSGRKVWLNDQIQQISRGLKKYHVKKARSSFCAAQVKLICDEATSHFDRVYSAAPGLAKKLALKFKTIVKFAFIFLLRLEDEGTELTLGSIDDDVNSDLAGRSHVISACKKNNREMAVVKLMTRKNKQSFNSNGHSIVRYCSCSKIDKDFRHQQGTDFCPVHILKDFVKQMGDNVKPGDKLFSGFTPSNLLEDIRQIVSQHPDILGPSAEAGLHCFRRGAAEEAFSQGMSMLQIRQLGDWYSSAATVYVNIDAQNAEQAHAVVQNWEDSD